MKLQKFLTATFLATSLMSVSPAYADNHSGCESADIYALRNGPQSLIDRHITVDPKVVSEFAQVYRERADPNAIYRVLRQVNQQIERHVSIEVENVENNQQRIIGAAARFLICTPLTS